MLRILLALLFGSVTAFAASLGIGTNAVQIVLTNAASLLSAPTNVGKITTAGYFTPGDGGGGEFVWSSGDTTTTNHGSVWLRTGAAGRWINNPVGGAYDIRLFGARTNLAIDNSAAIQKCFDTANGDTIIPGGIFRVDSSLTYTNFGTLFAYGTLYSKVVTGAALTIGSTNGNYSPSVYGLRLLAYQQNWWTNVNTGIKLQNLHSAHVHIHRVQGFGTNIHSLGSYGQLYGYNEHYLGEIIDGRVLLLVSTFGGGSANNENNFHGGRYAWSDTADDYTNTVGILISESALHNDNRFFNPSIERNDSGNGKSTPIIAMGYRNEFNSVHIEGGSSFSNILAFGRNKFTGANGLYLANITDLGTNEVDTIDGIVWPKSVRINYTNGHALNVNGALSVTNQFVGIGTTNPIYPLDIVGNLQASGAAYLGTEVRAPFVYTEDSGLNKSVMTLTSSGTQHGKIQVPSSGPAAGSWQLGYALTASSAFGTPVLTWTGAGNVGIGPGATSPLGQLSVWSTDAGTANIAYPLWINHETSGSPAAGFGTGILFNGERSDGAEGVMAAIYGVWAAPTAGVEDGDLVVAPVLNGSITERARFLNTGEVGIGTNSPQDALHVLGDIRLTGQTINMNHDATRFIEFGNSSPEGARSSGIGSIFVNTNNGDLYQKTSGTGNTGWVLNNVTSGGSSEVVTNGNGITVSSNNSIFTVSANFVAGPNVTLTTNSGVITITATTNTGVYRQYSAFSTAATGTTEDSVLSGAVASSGSLTIPANTLVVGSVIRIHVAGSYSTGVTPGTVVVKPYFAGTQVDDSTARTLPVSVVDKFCEIVCELLVWESGGNYFLADSGRFSYEDVTTGVMNTVNVWRAGGSYGFDRTIDNAIDLKVTFSNAGTAATFQTVLVELLK